MPDVVNLGGLTLGGPTGGPSKSALPKQQAGPAKKISFAESSKQPRAVGCIQRHAVPRMAAHEQHGLLNLTEGDEAMALTTVHVTSERQLVMACPEKADTHTHAWQGNAGRHASTMASEGCWVVAHGIAQGHQNTR